MRKTKKGLDLTRKSSEKSKFFEEVVKKLNETLVEKQTGLFSPIKSGLGPASKGRLTLIK